MKILLEIAILVALNVFLFGYVQRKMAFLVIAQRNQIIVLKRSVEKPKIKERDRQLWMFLSRIWADWKDHLVIVKPSTVIDWNRRKFKDYWRKISQLKKKVGRPPIKQEHIDFIKKISAVLFVNAFWTKAVLFVNAFWRKTSGGPYMPSVGQNG